MRREVIFDIANPELRWVNLKFILKFIFKFRHLGINICKEVSFEVHVYVL